MENYWISFRIANDAGYDQRYNSLTEAMDKACGGWWAETSSFYLATSDLDIAALGKRITTGLEATKDILVMRYLAKEGSRYFGPVKHLDILRAYLPSIQKL